LRFHSLFQFSIGNVVVSAKLEKYFQKQNNPQAALEYGLAQPAPGEPDSM
jgi:hypothetical protein